MENNLQDCSGSPLIPYVSLWGKKKQQQQNSFLENWLNINAMAL